MDGAWALVAAWQGGLAGPEWPATVDVAQLLADGWRPAPFREFVLKIHSRCDLACDYCYVYTKADQSWRHQPRVMPRKIADQVAIRIAEHTKVHGLDSVKLILHGGEPLLAGPGLIRHVVSAVRVAAGSRVEVDSVVQSNGVRLDRAFLDFFLELGIRVGVSLDGAAAAQDRHRKHADGRGSHEAVSRAIRLLSSQRYRKLFGGILCTVDLRNDPVATYEALLEYGPPMVDFLFPHGNWTAPPDHKVPDFTGTAYGDWLIAVFDRWYQVPVRETRVRLFTEIMHLILGGESATETVGLSPVAVVVVETDGSIEQSDNLKSAYAGAARTGLHVSTHTFDDALFQPGVAARQIGSSALAAQCRACRVMSVCGGGQYAHRYKAGTGFLNPTVYCPDLLRLVTHVTGVMRTDIAALRAAK